MPCTRRVSDGQMLTRSNAINCRERVFMAPSYSQLPLPATFVSCAHLSPGTGLSQLCHPLQGPSQSAFSYLPTVLPAGSPALPRPAGRRNPH